MSKKQPNNFLAPFVIAGITAGFFISAYRFVFAKPTENYVKKNLIIQKIKLHIQKCKKTE